MAEYIGIDLGTTNSALAYVREDGNPEIVPNTDGERLTPSVVYFDNHDGIKLVGSAARDGGDPSRTVHNIKRMMDDPRYHFEIDDKQWSPTEISALILAKLKRDCEQIIGPVGDVVITVPANFNELARKNTITAGKIAGLNISRIVNEPTAAAIYYAQMKQIEGRVLVYDLGGGTLDVTILEVIDGNIDILLSEGARHLGGTNFDEQLLKILAQEYQKKNRAELFVNERQRRRALSVAEDAKRMLSKVRQISETIGNDEDGIARVEITREAFEESISRLLTRTVMLVEQALDSVGLTERDIDHVVLVGGSTRIPKVQEILKKMFGYPPMTCGNVDECVALGAALFAKNHRKISEVCNHGYGTLAIIEDAKSGAGKFQNSIVIPKNTPIPCAMSQTYMTSEDNETLIEVEVTQGEDTDPKYVDIIGKISLDVPPNRPAGCEITVAYTYDENQRVSARIIDKDSGKSKEVDIEYAGEGVLSDIDIERKSSYLKQIRIE
ncbi:MAG: molecular chaperone DnaK [Verrucomicrobiales bacterium]|jgi:molecular chaperone DnaK